MSQIVHNDDKSIIEVAIRAIPKIMDRLKQCGLEEIRIGQEIEATVTPRDNLELLMDLSKIYDYDPKNYKYHNITGGEGLISNVYREKAVEGVEFVVSHQQTKYKSPGELAIGVEKFKQEFAKKIIEKGTRSVSYVSFDINYKSSNGNHINISVEDKNGNIFIINNHPNSYYVSLKNYIGYKIDEISKELMPLIAPNEDSYKRYHHGRISISGVPGYFGTGTTGTVHLHYGFGADSRLELKIAGADTNNIISIFNGLLGLLNAIDDTKHVKVTNGKLEYQMSQYSNIKGEEGLPKSFEESLEKFQSGKKVRELLNSLENGLGEQFQDIVKSWAKSRVWSQKEYAEKVLFDRNNMNKTRSIYYI